MILKVKKPDLTSVSVMNEKNNGTVLRWAVGIVLSAILTINIVVMTSVFASQSQFATTRELSREQVISAERFQHLQNQIKALDEKVNILLNKKGISVYSN